MKDQKILGYFFVLVAVVLLGFAVYKTFLAGKGTADLSSSPTTDSVVEQVPPTLSPEQKEIVSKIETNQVNITDTKVDPVNVVVKQYDQVQFFNKSSKEIKVDGQTWGKVPLQPGENMTQGFNELGEFAYTVSGVNLRGTVTVK